MGPLHQRVPAAHRYLPHVLRHLIPGACPRALGPGGCCAFRENASAATSALTVTARPRRGLPLRSTLAPAWGGKPCPQALDPRVVAHFAKTRPPLPSMPPRPVRTAGTRPLAEPGRVVARFAKIRPPPRRCHRDPSGPPGRSPSWTLAGSLRISRKLRPQPPPMPPRPVRTAGTQPLADPRRVVAHFAKTRPPPPPMPPRPIATVGIQPLADPGRVVAHFAKTRPRPAGAGAPAPAGCAPGWPSSHNRTNASVRCNVGGPVFNGANGPDSDVA